MIFRLAGVFFGEFLVIMVSVFLWTSTMSPQLKTCFLVFRWRSGDKILGWGLLGLMSLKTSAMFAKLETKKKWFETAVSFLLCHGRSHENFFPKSYNSWFRTRSLKIFSSYYYLYFVYLECIYRFFAPKLETEYIWLSNISDLLPIVFCVRII